AVLLPAALPISKVIEQPGYVLGIPLRVISARVLRVVAAPSSPEIGADEAPLARERLDERLEVAAVASEPGNAEHGQAISRTGKVPVPQRQPVGAGPLALSIGGRAF